MKIVLSAAMSRDGYLDDSSPQRLILSCPQDLQAIQELRASCDAILVGANTIRRDNPSLATRDDKLRQKRIAAGLLPDPMKVTITVSGNIDPAAKFFTDGAGGKGIYHAMEGATYFTYADMRREADSISPGNYPKFCSLEIVHSPTFPADWQGQFITCDFRAHRIVRFGSKEVGSTFQTMELPDVVRSTNVTFRPIDLRFGPDGALYIADWSNPIIQHGEVDFRDPRRDKEHGRIWRVAAKGRKVGDGSRRDLTRLNNEGLLALTLSKNGWDQEQARLVLRQRPASEVLKAVDAWLPKQTEARAKLEAMWLYEAFERSPDALVQQLAGASDPRYRAAAARQLAR